MGSISYMPEEEQRPMFLAWHDMSEGGRSKVSMKQNPGFDPVGNHWRLRWRKRWDQVYLRSLKVVWNADCSMEQEQTTHLYILQFAGRKRVHILLEGTRMKGC